MVSFPGYEKTIKSVYDNAQEQVFTHWNGCSEAEKKALLDELSSVDFAALSSLYATAQEPVKFDMDFGPAPFVTRPKDDSGKARWEKAKNEGEAYLRGGKVAAFVVAGGQGSRLGFEGPKGAFRMSPVKNKPLFQIHAEKIHACSRKYGYAIPFFVMTSGLNHRATVDLFEESGYFGLDRKDVFFFPQNMIPSMDTKGKLILSSKCGIFKNPDGHGGSLTALRTSGALDEMKKRGIETISYFQIDNPTVNIVDPFFIGFHAGAHAEVSSKALIKAYPEEKVGNFVRYPDGHETVIEYSDLPKEKAFEKNADGSLVYAAGSIAIHLFDRAFVERITSGGSLSLPFHVANKKIKQYTGTGTAEIDGYKFEKFVFDAIPLASASCIIETLREEEFAPVKNASGVDSVETSQKLMDGLFRSWCAERGIKIPKGVKVLEISPEVAVCAEDLDPGLVIPDLEKAYIGK